MWSHACRAPQLSADFKSKEYQKEVGISAAGCIAVLAATVVVFLLSVVIRFFCCCGNVRLPPSTYSSLLHLSTNSRRPPHRHVARAEPLFQNLQDHNHV